MTEKNLITLPDIAGVLATNGHFASKAAARAALAAAFGLIGAALRFGEAVQIKGFGRFEARDTPERPGRNPKTGEPRTIAAHRRAKFKASKSLLDSRGDRPVARTDPPVSPAGADGAESAA